VNGRNAQKAAIRDVVAHESNRPEAAIAVQTNGAKIISVIEVFKTTAAR
jgi:hypothetical protein